MWMGVGLICLLGIIVGIIGTIVLAIKKSPQWKKWLAGSGVALVLLLVAAVNSPKTVPREQNKKPASSESAPSVSVATSAPETDSNSVPGEQQKPSNAEVFKKQQEAFNTWLYQYNEYSKQLDVKQREVVAILESLTKENADSNTVSPGRNEAYIKLTGMYWELSDLRINVYNLKPPGELSIEHQELLESASKELHSAVSSTDTARRYLVKYLEDLKPSTITWANNSSKDIKPHLDNSTAKVSQVKKDFGF